MQKVLLVVAAREQREKEVARTEHNLYGYVSQGSVFSH